MRLTAETLSKIAAKPINDNMRSVVIALDRYAARFGLNQPHRLAHYIAQLAHESMGFTYDGELWGPSAQQLRYERDFAKPWVKGDPRNGLAFQLGNSQKGDGARYKGRTAGQITGRANYQAFYDWCKKEGLAPPDFVANPELLNTDPWEGLGFIWYWSTRKLNAYADKNDIETITKRVNGGLNGFEDRVDWYVRAALVFLGFNRNDIRSFQLEAQRAGVLPPGAKEVDGDAGPKTRTAMHLMLTQLTPENTATQAAPVAVETEVAVVPKGAQNTTAQRIWAGVGILSPMAGVLAGFNQTGVLIMVGLSVLAVVVLLVRGEQIAARTKAVLRSFDEPA